MKHIFKNVFVNLIRGIMLYDELAQAFAFLRFPAQEAMFSRLYTKQSEAYRDMCAYYTERYDTLAPVGDPDYSAVIPGKWYDLKSDDIDRDDAARYLLSRWADWERRSRNVYRRCYNELVELGDEGAACKIFELVVNAGVEAIKAERCLDNGTEV